MKYIYICVFVLLTTTSNSQNISNLLEGFTNIDAISNSELLTGPEVITRNLNFTSTIINNPSFTLDYLVNLV